jgi:SAM-dependent methyltransferase
MHQTMHWPLSFTLFKRDGYEPLELYEVMGWRQRLSRTAFWHVTASAWLEKLRPNHRPAMTQRNRDPEIATHILKRTLAGLRRRTRRTVLSGASSNWSEYRSTLSHYTPEQSSQKYAWVQQVLEQVQPKRVLDIGANTGEFSALAATTGTQVIALERDAAAAEHLFLMSRASSPSIQTIHADVARPTPAVGWNNLESLSLLQRLEERCDLVLMLAVIHHLLLMEQIPLPAILALCQRLTTRHLVIEWVPVEDPMYRSLMRGRESLYGSLSQDDLQAACVGRFQLLQQQTLDNGRTLFLFEKCSAS